MKIKSKGIAKEFIDSFDKIAQWDQWGNKHYFSFIERLSDETITIMKYPDETLTINRKKDDWHSDGENLITKDALADLIWKSRGNVNKEIQKQLNK